MQRTSFNARKVCYSQERLFRSWQWAWHLWCMLCLHNAFLSLSPDAFTLGAGLWVAWDSFQRGLKLLSTFRLLFNLYILYFHKAHSLPQSLAKFPYSAKTSHSTQASSEAVFFQLLTALWKSVMQTPTLHKRHSNNDPKHLQPMCTNTSHQYSMRK